MKMRIMNRKGRYMSHAIDRFTSEPRRLDLGMPDRFLPILYEEVVRRKLSFLDNNRHDDPPA